MIKRIVFLTALLGAAVCTAASPVDDAFDAWVQRYRAAATTSQRAALVQEGLAAARARRAELLEAARLHPADALRRQRSSAGLPSSITALMERRFDTTARYEVLCEYGAPMTHWLELGGQRYRVTPFGRGQALTSRDSVRLKGFVLGDRAVLDEGAVPRADTQASPWTVGVKRVLYVRVDFSDDVGQPITEASALAVLGQLDTFMKDNSHNKTSIVPTVTPVLRMPRTKASYASSNGTSQLLSDARAAAQTAGFPGANYELDVIAFRKVTTWGWAGLGRVGGKGTWINGSYGLGVIAHELGHNFGLSHANFWVAPGDTIIGSGNSQEYGNPFDTMGSGDGHFNAWYKSFMGWHLPSEVGVASVSGTYRVQDLEQPVLGGLHSLKVPISGARDYWLEYRPNGGGALNRTAVLFWGFPSPQTSQLLDMTPWSNNAQDAPLELGRTFSDASAGIHITPVALPQTNPPSIDLVVNRGAFSGNNAPTVTLSATATQVAVGTSVMFSATAMDADGDPLAYHWDFGDSTITQNQSVMTRSVSTPRDVLARVTVSDLKGGVASAQVAVRWGNPSTARVTGRVTDNMGGQGVEGVRVVRDNRFTFTASDGTYALVGVAQDSKPVTAVKPGWTTSPTFSNPVTVPASGVSGIDFTASRAGFGIFGQVTSVGQGLPGVTISAGPYSTTTNASGNYQLTNVPNGIYTLVATGPANEVFDVVGWTNPVSVSGAPVTGRNFAERVVPVSGEVTGLPGPHTITAGGLTATTGLTGGRWLWTLPRVPPGSINIVATAPSQRITPTFTNPVAVGSTPVTGLIFNAVAGEGFLVTGRVDEAGEGLAATQVVALDGLLATVATGVTDGDGRYALVVPSGAFTIEPRRSGYTFTPTSRSVTVAGVDITGQDFGVLGANARPVIVFPPTATPFPVVGTTADLFVLGDDPAPGSEIDLTYTWAQLFGPAAATFSLNGSNAAKATTVTFPRAGAWGFRVTVADPGGLTVTADLTVVVPQAPTLVVVTPATITINLGDVRQFASTVTDQFTLPIDLGGDAAWSIDGCGTLTSWGRLTADTVGDCTLTATVGGISGTSAVKVVVGPVPRILSATVTPDPVVGDTAQGAVVATDNDGEPGLTYTWTAESPPGAVTFTPNGTNAAKATTIVFSALGQHTLRVDVTDDRGLTASEFVVVDVQLGLQSLSLTPATTEVKPGETATFTVQGRDQRGGAVAVSGCDWTASAGAVDSNGVFTAGAEEADVTVTVTCAGKTATAAVKVTKTPTTTPGGCGCGAGENVSPLAFLAALLGLTLRSRRRTRLVARTVSFSAAALPLALVALTGCTSNSEGPVATDAVAHQRFELGEPAGGYPSDQERMLHVLINQARHSATTPNNNECGNHTAEVGMPKLTPLVYSREANHGARFSARHMSEVGCYQNDNCCQLGDAGVGVGCIAPGACSGTQCAQTCDAGPGQTADQRYGLFGFNTLSGVAVARNVAGAYDLWCGLMQSSGQRGLIYNDAGTEFSAGLYQAGGQQCTSAYWALAYGRGAAQAPLIPAASAIYTPPNPLNSSQMYFASNYFDPTGAAPRRAAVVVAGHCFDMDRAWGYDDNGTWETRFPDPDVLPDGCHPYYFLFVDGAGNRVTYPTAGSLQVPVGSGVTCPLSYDPGPQTAADCETGEQQCPAGARRPCFTADTALLANGECRQGNQQCRNGLWGACRDMVGPFAEACDGLDNDCDGEVDEGNPGAGASCAVFGELGACQAGERTCLSGRLTCVSTKQPVAEICNNLDDDCDGQIDDGFGQQACGQGNCYRLVNLCVNGLPQTCDAGVANTELDNGEDDDCDGQYDEDFDCHLPDGGGVNRTRSFYAIGGAPVRLPCEQGVQRCLADGGWQTLTTGRFPRPEVCNGEDDDCDGRLENDRDTQTLIGWDRCGVGGCTVLTASRCVAGSPRTCTPGTAGAEVCDGVDNDCDGTVDEDCDCRRDDTRQCYTGASETRDAGVCTGGQRTCPDGTYTRCTGEVKPSQELCDGLDNDCDGDVDEQCLAVDGGTGGGAGGGAGGAGGGDVDGGTGGGGGGGGGCGCAGVPDAFGALSVLALLLGARRRRRA